MALSDEIKERLDIVELVGSYVPNLQRAGRNYKALCPFHTERTPSFVVFPERQSWRCFGACATGGDVLSFVMRTENLSFGDTLKLLAQRAGVAIPQHREREEHHGLFQVNEVASAFFQDVLRSPQGIAARTYLQQRGLDTESVGLFDLGLSPGSGSALLEHLLGLGYPQEQIVRAGLVTQSTDGTLRDMFQGRLMFPIRDDRGNLAGFGGRSLDGSEPKYLNSARTEVFDKGRILYAFNRAKDSIKAQGEGVVVEGYMDVIAAHQYGFDNVVASMGTALTEQQAMLLRGARLVLALDPDSAGGEATFRSLQEVFHALDVERVAGVSRLSFYQRRARDWSLWIAVLPVGKDPDEVIREDPEAWRGFVSKAVPLLEYYVSSVGQRFDLSSSEGKLQAAQEVYPFIGEMQNPFEQEKQLRRLAGTLGVPLATLEASLGRPQRSDSRRARRDAAPRTSAAAFERERRDRLEEHLLALVLQWPDLRDFVCDLAPEALERWENRQVFTCWIGCSRIEALLQGLDGDLRQRVEYLLSLPVPPMDLRQREQAAKDCFHRLEERRLRNLKAEEALLLDQGDQPEESQELRDLEQRAVDTNEELRRLFHAKSAYKRRG